MFTSSYSHNVPTGQVAVSTGISWARKHAPDDTQGIRDRTMIRILNTQALTSGAQLVGCRPAKQKAAGLIPGQGTRLGCGFGPQLRCVQETTSLSFPLPPLLSKKKLNLF